MTEIFSSQLHDELMARLAANRDQLGDVTIPPKVFVTLGGQFTDFDESQRWLKARFPVAPRFENPYGFMQGGIITAAIDNVLGPLTFLLGTPAVTLELNTRYLRPVPPGTAYIDVEARVVESTRSLLHMEGRALNPAGKTVVLSTSIFSRVGA